MWSNSCSCERGREREKGRKALPRRREDAERTEKAQGDRETVRNNVTTPFFSFDRVTAQLMKKFPDVLKVSRSPCAFSVCSAPLRLRGK